MTFTSQQCKVCNNIKTTGHTWREKDLCLTKKLCSLQKKLLCTKLMAYICTSTHIPGFTKLLYQLCHWSHHTGIIIILKIIIIFFLIYNFWSIYPNNELLENSFLNENKSLFLSFRTTQQRICSVNTPYDNMWKVKWTAELVLLLIMPPKCSWYCLYYMMCIYDKDHMNALWVTQLVEHHTGIEKVMGSNPIGAS